MVRLEKPLIRSLEILGFLNSMVYESLRDFDLICTGRGRREREVYFSGSLYVFFSFFFLVLLNNRCKSLYSLLFPKPPTMPKLYVVQKTQINFVAVTL